MPRLLVFLTFLESKILGSSSMCPQTKMKSMMRKKTILCASTCPILTDQDGEMFFADPQQLLQLFVELEEHNLSLIQNGQEIEEQLQDLVERTQADRARMTKAVDSLLS